MERRLDAWLSNLGYSTRKDAKKFLKQNDLTVNGVKQKYPSFKAKHEEILLNGEPLDPQNILILMNKPPRTICSHKDDGALIFNLLPARWAFRIPKVSTIGRLDADTTGAILISDNGELNHKLTSPRSSVSKVYEVTLADPLKGDESDIFASGELMLKNEDKPCLPAKLNIINDKLVHLEIIEGRYHQVKRMFAALGNKVEKLHRVSFAGLTVEDLKEGEYKFINIDDIK